MSHWRYFVVEYQECVTAMKELGCVIYARNRWMGNHKCRLSGLSLPSSSILPYLHYFPTYLINTGIPFSTNNHVQYLPPPLLPQSLFCHPSLSSSIKLSSKIQPWVVSTTTIPVALNLQTLFAGTSTSQLGTKFKQHLTEAVHRHTLVSRLRKQSRASTPTFKTVSKKHLSIQDMFFRTGWSL